jgi:hypothetical protein
MPAARSTERLAEPEELRATLANWTALPLNWSLIVTVPLVTGLPPDMTLTVRGCTQPLSVPAVSVVVMDTPSAGTASAITNPATNTSRESRHFMPLTCTCSKDQKSSAARLPQPKTLLYPAGADWSQPARAIRAKKQKISQGQPLPWLDAARRDWEV